MSGQALKTEYIRDGLSEVILGELNGWPDDHRQIFIQSHYRGQSPEQVSRSFGMCASDVRLVLNLCERRLREALKAYREPKREPESTASLGPPAIATSGFISTELI
jgi:DNA-directed RNA polymerase specialized sigma24 family protein